MSAAVKAEEKASRMSEARAGPVSKSGRHSLAQASSNMADAMREGTGPSFLFLKSATQKSLPVTEKM